MFLSIYRELLEETWRDLRFWKYAYFRLIKKRRLRNIVIFIKYANKFELIVELADFFSTINFLKFKLVEIFDIYRLLARRFYRRKAVHRIIYAMTIIWSRCNWSNMVFINLVTLINTILFYVSRLPPFFSP